MRHIVVREVRSAWITHANTGSLIINITIIVVKGGFYVRSRPLYIEIRKSLIKEKEEEIADERTFQ